MNLHNISRITFIGGGNMASSIIGGLIHSGLNPTQIAVSDPFATSRDNLAAEFGIHTYDNNAEACQGADIIVLAVKPQILKGVCLELAPTIRAEQLIVSIAAGITCASIIEWLGTSAIVRTMPNTPALVGAGACGLYATPNVSAIQKRLAEQVMQSVGITAWVEEEKLIDAVTAVSGSGPAYFFLFIEAMIASAQNLGLDNNTASTLAIQTAMGAAKLAQNSDVDVTELRRRVTSPNGTTEKAIASFQSHQLEGIVQHAMQACSDRAQSLAEELGR